MIIYEQHDYDGDGYEEAFGVSAWTSSGNTSNGNIIYFMSSNGSVKKIGSAGGTAIEWGFASCKAYRIGNKYFFVSNNGGTMAGAYALAYGVRNNTYYSIFSSKYQYISVSSNNKTWTCKNYSQNYGGFGYNTVIHTYKYSNGKFTRIS